MAAASRPTTVPKAAPGSRSPCHGSDPSDEEYRGQTPYAGRIKVRPMLMALTREISPSFQDCELTHLNRVPIDLDRARAQHSDYEWALVEAGCTVRRLDTSEDLPDSVFIE